MLLDQVINEIRHLKPSPTHRSALEIHRLLEANESALKKRIDALDLRILIADFKRLSEAGPAELNSAGYKREYDRLYNLLMFYLEKFI